MAARQKTRVSGTQKHPHMYRHQNTPRWPWRAPEWTPCAPNTHLCDWTRNKLVLPNTGQTREEREEWGSNYKGKQGGDLPGMTQNRSTGL